MILYMVTTADKYELPLAVGTIKDVARFFGIKPISVYQKLSPSRQNTKSNFKVIRVEVDED